MSFILTTGAAVRLLYSTGNRSGASLGVDQVRDSVRIGSERGDILVGVPVWTTSEVQ